MAEPPVLSLASDRRARVVRLFRESDGEISIGALSRRFNCSYWTIRNILIAEANGGKIPPKGRKAADWRNLAAAR
jgi:hypothetical protein